MTSLIRKLPVSYHNTKLSGYGESFSIDKTWHPIIDSWSPLYKDILEAFDFHKFTAPRLPIDMGTVNKTAIESCSNVLRVPIKWEGSDLVCLPKELAPVKEEIIRLLQYDYFINSNFTDSFAHLTIDNRIVEEGQTHRYGGFHGDGLQGGKFKTKVICEHSYVCTFPYATHIAMQPFFVAHINENRFNIFKEFDKQVIKEALYKLRDGHIYLIDPYIIHASPAVPKTMKRSFFRLTISPEELLTPHNTVNPMFEGQKYPEGIEVREFVTDPDVSIPLDFYGIEAL